MPPRSLSVIQVQAWVVVWDLQMPQDVFHMFQKERCFHMFQKTQEPMETHNAPCEENIQ